MKTKIISFSAVYYEITEMHSECLILTELM